MSSFASCVGSSCEGRERSTDYRAMFEELNEPAEAPTVVVHVPRCETAIGDSLREVFPRPCSCPDGVATVADGDGPVNDAVAA